MLKRQTICWRQWKCSNLIFLRKGATEGVIPCRFPDSIPPCLLQSFIHDLTCCSSLSVPLVRQNRKIEHLIIIISVIELFGGQHHFRPHSTNWQSTINPFT